MPASWLATDHWTCWDGAAARREPTSGFGPIQMHAKWFQPLWSIQGTISTQACADPAARITGITAWMHHFHYMMDRWNFQLVGRTADYYAAWTRAPFRAPMIGQVRQHGGS